MHWRLHAPKSVSACGSMRFLPSAPAETVEPPLGEAIPEGLLELNEVPDVPDVPVEPLTGLTSETPATAVGSNFLTGFLSGAMNTFFAPERQAAEQRGGAVAQLVTHGVFLTTAWFVSRSSPCRGVAQVIGSAFQRVPLLGQGTLGSVVQMVVGAQLGEFAGRRLGELRGTTTCPAVGAEEGAPFEIYLSEMCVLCHDAFGNGANRVAALSCGHACLCSDNGCASWKQEFFCIAKQTCTCRSLAHCLPLRDRGSPMGGFGLSGAKGLPSLPS